MGARWYDPALGRFISADTIVPDPANPQTLNRFAYALSNPIMYSDPSGHYVCSGANDAWGELTCYDVIDRWLTFLYENGGAEGRNLVNEVRSSGLDWPIEIRFVDEFGDGAWAKTSGEGKLIRIAASATSAGMSLNDLALQSSLLGHELVHLLRQSYSERGTVWAEKRAYDTQYVLLQNMGLNPERSPAFEQIYQAEYTPEGLASIAHLTGGGFHWPPGPNATALETANGFADEIVRPAFQALIVAWQAVSGCYGVVCTVPGWQNYAYRLPGGQVKPGR
jgi:hypothetical protein